jgi:dTDP-4-amino-4,6-dideoxygalactose transaminase
MTTGEGGMIATNDEDAYRWFLKARHHGINKSPIDRQGEKNDWEYNIDFIGWKANNTDIAAAIGLEQLKKLPKMTFARNVIVATYNKRLGYSRNGNHLYPVLVEDREKFINLMKEAGIQCSVHFLPIHNMTAYDKGEKLPNTEWLGKRLVSLPLYPTLTLEEVEFICKQALKTKLLIH